MNDVYESMLELKPTTPDGCRAMALAIVDFHGSDGVALGRSYQDEGLAVISSSLSGVPLALAD